MTSGLESLESQIHLKQLSHLWQIERVLSASQCHPGGVVATPQYNSGDGMPTSQCHQSLPACKNFSAQCHPAVSHHTTYQYAECRYNRLKDRLMAQLSMILSSQESSAYHDLVDLAASVMTTIGEELFTLPDPIALTAGSASLRQYKKNEVKKKWSTIMSQLRELNVLDSVQTYPPYVLRVPVATEIYTRAWAHSHLDASYGLCRFRRTLVAETLAQVLGRREEYFKQNDCEIIREHIHKAVKENRERREDWFHQTWNRATCVTPPSYMKCHQSDADAPSKSKKRKKAVEKPPKKSAEKDTSSAEVDTNPQEVVTETCIPTEECKLEPREEPLADDLASDLKRTDECQQLAIVETPLELYETKEEPIELFDNELIAEQDHDAKPAPEQEQAQGEQEPARKKRAGRRKKMPIEGVTTTPSYLDEYQLYFTPV